MWGKYLLRIIIWTGFLYMHCVIFSNDAVFGREINGLEIQCGEIIMRIKVKREFFEERRIPFAHEHILLGNNSTQCPPVLENPFSESEMSIYVGLQECGTESRVNGDWLIYHNQLILLPAVIPIAKGGLIVKRPATVIPVECYYKRKQTVSGEPLSPTWQPMTSTISAYGLLHFTLRTMSDDWISPHSSSVYQQGETVFLQASVASHLHTPLRIYVDYCVATLKSDPLSLPSYKFITNYGCLVDSVLPESSSMFFPREQENSLRFSFQAFRFQQDTGDQMFITCHLRATLKQNPPDNEIKACYFNSTTFSWLVIEGDGALCKCCHSQHCIRQNGTVQDKKHESHAAVVPVNFLPRSNWTGQLTVGH